MVKDDTSGKTLNKDVSAKNGPIYTIHDTSQSVNAQLRELANQLEITQLNLQKQTDALKEAQAQLRHAEKLTLIGKFSAGAVHELNNPLTVIAAEADEILDAASGDRADCQFIRTSADHIKDCADRMRYLIDQIRTYARKDTRDTRTDLDVNQVIKNALLMVKPRLQQGAINLKLTLRDDLSPVRGNGHNLESAFQNIIANAADALSSNRSCEDHIITITTEETHQAGISVTISDNGCGMTQHVQKQIFEPFFTTKSLGSGTGLGLALTRNHIHEHGGSLEVSSRPGEGTVFRIQLPTVGCEPTSPSEIAA